MILTLNGEIDFFAMDLCLFGGLDVTNNDSGNSYSFAASITKVTGAHTLKFGADVRRYQFREGQTVFMRSACINCHTIAGTVATGRFGPDLTHLASRDTIASGPVKNTPENLRQWITDPNSMKPGVLMPSMHLNDHDLDVITAYLTTLH